MFNWKHHYLIATLVCLLCTPVNAGYMINSYSTFGSGAADECTDKLLCQNFEGVGYDNAESWSSNATADPDYQGGLVLRGTDSMEFDFDNASPTTETTFSSTGEIWFHTKMRFTYIDASTFSYIILRDASDTEDVLRLRINSGNTYLYVGTVSDAYGSALFAIDTDYHLWIHLDTANDSAELYLGTTTTRPGVADLTVTSGNATATTVGILRMNNTPDFKATGDALYLDQVIIDDASFTTVEN